MGERIDRSHPPLGSRVSMAELSGSQKIEAKATDTAVALLPKILGGTFRISQLGQITEHVTSLSHLENEIRTNLGARVVRRLKREVLAQFGTFENVNPDGCEFQIRETLSQWASRRAELETQAQVDALSVSSPRREVRFRPNGLPRGPGSHSERKPKKDKRHNGRGRAGKNLST